MIANAANGKSGTVRGGSRTAHHRGEQELLLAMIHDAIAHLVNPVHRLSDARPILERIERLLEARGPASTVPSLGYDLLSLLAPSGVKHNSIAVALVARDYHLVGVSEAACTLFGYTKVELLKTKALDLVHHDDLWLAVVQFQMMFAEKIPGFRIGVRALRHDNGTLPVTLCVQALGRPNDTDHCMVLIEPRRAAKPKLRTHETTELAN